MSTSLHALLLLSDSALPLGSFAFSNGLESHLAHTKHRQHQHHHSSTSSHMPRTSITSTPLPLFLQFLHQTLQNTTFLLLPYLLSAYTTPSSLKTLDDTLDASTPCTVARRASTVQGRALLTLWERSLSLSCPASAATTALSEFSASLKAAKADIFGCVPNAHFAPLFGVVCAAMGLSKTEAGYVFLLNQAKGVVSAGVRASVLGPYQGQMVLGGAELRGWIEGLVSEEIGRERGVEEAGVVVPVLDLWIGRHELLYSRIFNS
ncbi:hypothetical protein MBLNU457_g0732t1 [Dothideomycetes sp. NU457]